MAEEYVDAHRWRAGGALFRATKKVERAVIRVSAAVVVLTANARSLFQQWYAKELGGIPINVIPFCVDLSRFPFHSRVSERPEAKTLTYVGKLGGWYLEDEMASFVSIASQRIPELRWQIWTQSTTESLTSLLGKYGISHQVSVGSVPPESLGEKMAMADGGLSFIRPCLSKRSSSPTKVSEYLAAGLPVISTRGIGDLDDILLQRGVGARNSPVGVLVKDFTTAAYEQAFRELRELWQDPTTPDRCRAVAREKFDLQLVGWKRYSQIYRDLQF